jgi:hypothetical protein
MPSISGNDGTPSGFTPRAPFGVWGDSGSRGGPFDRGGNGVIGSAGLSSGVAGFTLADSNRAAGVYGEGPAVGVAGGVNGSNTAPDGRAGVYGTGSNGQSLGGTGVFGESDTGAGVIGKASNFGVGAFNTQNNHAAYLASGCCAAYFTGDVYVGGHLSKASGGFKVDHPDFPAEKFLTHSFVESSEMKNIYDGVVELDGSGHAAVRVPRWFDSVNSDLRYQLTAVGGAAPDLHIAEELAEGEFKIAGGRAGMKVCWQITGIRIDPWARANPIIVETDKTDEERGYYLNPELYGEGPEKDMSKVYHGTPSVPLPPP